MRKWLIYENYTINLDNLAYFKVIEIDEIDDDAEYPAEYQVWFKTVDGYTDKLEDFNSEQEAREFIDAFLIDEEYIV